MAVYILILLVFLPIFFAVKYIYGVLNVPGQKVPSIPDKDKHILTLPASILVEKLTNDEIRSEDIVQAYITRIKEVNALINAVVQERFDAALDEAREIDRSLESLSQRERQSLFSTKVLNGIPFTCKEAFGFKGLPQTGGLYRRRDRTADKNAVVVQKMLDAGAILLAVTNVSELCMWWESTNCVYGRSRNPYNSEYIVGGSSGGEAAIIAAAGSVIGIGSDIGGSIRMPAFFNGVFGHKPSPGMVSNLGQFPVKTTEAAALMLATGPICRYSVDLKLMLKVISPNTDLQICLDRDVNISKLKFYSCIGNCGLLAENVCSELLNAQENVCNFLTKKIEAPVAKLEFPLLKHAVFIWLTRMSLLGRPTFGELLFDQPNSSTGMLAFWEFLKWCLGQSNHTFPAIRLAALESFKTLLPKSLEGNALKNNEKLREEIEEVLGEDGVLLFPSHPTTGLRHSMPIFKLNNFIYTAIFNTLHLPVTQVPLGLDSNGLPLGIQVVAGRNNDHLTLAVAKVLEKEFGGWVQP